MWFSGSSPFANYAYEYNGTQLISQKWNNNVMWFLYDESGNPVGFTLNDTAYYYLKNLQGDITAITDANGNIVAKYTYDEWGKPLSITDGNGNDVSANASHIANVNPLRYRGYYYIRQGTVLCLDKRGVLHYNTKGDAKCQERQDRKAIAEYII